ncbi:MAG: glycosyltransferase family 2 protein [Lachnospiraceae bacterium]|nr:glycosyltransferase family 2 protein [Lachnospiraceae bacterium]
MIVKNEEATIERALSWGKGVVSEQIVVDTGSTDRTVEIAEQMGARVYHFQWIDDFAAAKNFAISKARYEWIAFLDADEYFTPEEAQFLKRAIQQLHVQGQESILTAWVNLENNGSVATVGTQRRIFRNIPTLRYKGRIHEAIDTLDGHKVPTVDMTKELSIYHTGYGATENSKKSGRNLRLIQMELEDHPDNYVMWGFMGQEYVSQENWEEAEKAFRRAVSLIPESMRGIYDTSTSITHLRLLEVLVIRPETKEEDLMEAYNQARDGWPEEADFDYTLGKHFASKGQWEKAELHLHQAIDILEQYGINSKSMVLAGNIQKAYELLAISCYNNRKMEDCLRYTTALLKENPYLMSTATVMLMAFAADAGTSALGEEGAREVAGFLGNTFYDLNSLKDRLFVLRAALAAGYQTLVQVIRGMFTSEELEAVDRALGV